MKEYVLVTQGIEIYRTKDKEKAENIMKRENESFYNYIQECLDNSEPYADNEIEIYEEDK